MAVLESLLVDLRQHVLPAAFRNPVLSVVFLFLSLLLSYLIYNVFLHPLRHIPGPFYATATPLWLWYHVWIGNEPSSIHVLHARYGTVVRVSPNDVDISDAAALAPIYSDHGGFMKTPNYSNFDIEGHETIFSTADPVRRASRAKSVASMFSLNSIRRDGDHLIRQYVTLFVDRVRREAASSKPVNIQDLSRRFAVDAVTGYLFGTPYGGLTESADQKAVSRMSASAFVDAFVAVGRFFLLPPQLYNVVDSLTQRMFPNSAIDTSIGMVHEYTDKLAADPAARSEKSNTYQGRLLRTGISEHETSVQCMDVMFAGTDSTATILATTLFKLVQQPALLARLSDELKSLTDPDIDPQTLPYLRAVIREGMRISLANPSRLPRVVPKTGWTFKDNLYIPAGAYVGCAAYSLHFDERIFPDPMSFKPERWLDANSDMMRSHVPFGVGPRQCIARNLATAELFWAIKGIVEQGVLEGAQCVGDRIELKEWFNAVIDSQKVELVWA